MKHTLLLLALTFSIQTAQANSANPSLLIHAENFAAQLLVTCTQSKCENVMIEKILSNESKGVLGPYPVMAIQRFIRNKHYLKTYDAETLINDLTSAFYGNSASDLNTFVPFLYILGASKLVAKGFSEAVERISDPNKKMNLVVNDLVEGLKGNQTESIQVSNQVFQRLGRLFDLEARSK